MSILELINRYGLEYLNENHLESVFPMNDFDENEKDRRPLDIVMDIINGYNYNTTGERSEPFQTGAEYYSFDGYGNYISIYKYLLPCYIKDKVNIDRFIKWAIEYHYKSISLDDNAIDWIKEKYPELMDWIKENYPELIDEYENE